MHHFRDLDDLHLKKSWVTIGVFDGVHRGHQAILDRLASGAQASGAFSAVVTFFPHPAIVLGKNNQPAYLTSPEQRAFLLSRLGIDYVITMTFDRQLAALSAQDFIERLHTRLTIERLCVGQDFALGRGREGDISRLREIGAQLGFDLDVIEPITNDGERISSSQVRNYILNGDMRTAARLLGRYYSVDGRVVPGDGRGKGLGFPTANLEYWTERVMPANGIYATWTWIDGVRYASVSNLGTRPTFDQPPSIPRLEAHIFNFDQDLYGKTLQVEFVERLRPEERFPSVDALVEQVHIDMKKAREVLEHAA